VDPSPVSSLRARPSATFPPANNNSAALDFHASRVAPVGVSYCCPARRVTARDPCAPKVGQRPLFIGRGLSFEFGFVRWESRHCSRPSRLVTGARLYLSVRQRRTDKSPRRYYYYYYYYYCRRRRDYYSRRRYCTFFVPSFVNRKSS